MAKFPMATCTTASQPMRQILTEKLAVAATAQEPEVKNLHVSDKSHIWLEISSFIYIFKNHYTDVNRIMTLARMGMGRAIQRWTKDTEDTLGLRSDKVGGLATSYKSLGRVVKRVMFCKGTATFGS